MLLSNRNNSYPSLSVHVLIPKTLKLPLFSELIQADHSKSTAPFFQGFCLIYQNKQMKVFYIIQGLQLPAIYREQIKLYPTWTHIKDSNPSTRWWWYQPVQQAVQFLLFYLWWGWSLKQINQNELKSSKIQK